MSNRPHVLLEVEYNGPGIAHVEVDYGAEAITLELREAPRPPRLTGWQSFIAGWRERR